MRPLRSLCSLLLLLATPLCLSIAQQDQPARNAVSADATSASPPGGSPPLAGESIRLEPVKMEKPLYPKEAKHKGIQGQVMLRVSISETGEVESVEAVRGDPVLIPSALAAVKKWRFKPFIKDGKPVKVATRIPMDFAFRDNIHDVLYEAGSTIATAESTRSAITLPAAMMAGHLIHRVAPVYPPSARTNHVHGTVVLQAAISNEGRIKELEVISGPRELVDSSIGAVQQWRYRPYLLNGEAVDVVTQILVNYQLR